jgi:hypothetical protein
VYDPSLVNDPSLLYDQPHNRGNKSGTSGNPGVTDTQRKR